jgi:hypothetical protein
VVALLVEQQHIPRYLIRNVVKCNVHTFFVAICLTCVQTSLLLHLNKPHLCVVHLKHMECAVLRDISRTLQFDLHTQKSESALYLVHH